MAQSRNTAWFLAIVTLSSLVLACDSGSDPTGLEAELPGEVGNFVTLMNDHRERVGCPPLVWNGQVAAVAQAHSRDMVDRGYFSHTDPDGDSPFDRLRAAGVSYRSAAENIAKGYPSAAAVLGGWLDSSGHRANIENCNLTEHGVGLEANHWTHVFIRP